jgi:hypothetical protein
MSGCLARAVGPSRILLLRLQHPPSHEPMHIALARHLLLRLGAGVRLRVGGELGEQAPSAARSSGRAARDQDRGTAGYSKRAAAHSDLAPEVPHGRAEGGSPRCSLPNLLWSPEPPVGLAG